MNGAADNPLVIVGDREILSNGNFHVPALAPALDAAAIAIAQVASAIAERQARVKTGASAAYPPVWSRVKRRNRAWRR